MRERRQDTGAEGWERDKGGREGPEAVLEPEPVTAGVGQETVEPIEAAVPRETAEPMGAAVSLPWRNCLWDPMRRDSRCSCGSITRTSLPSG